MRKLNALTLIIAFSLAMITGGLIFFWVPDEAVMGAVQKIFYFHVPSAIVAYLFCFISFVCGLLFIFREDSRFDLPAHVSAEVGWLFFTLVMLSGPVWGRAAWGKWWVMEPRLVSSLVMWMMYTAYVLFRLSAGPEKSAKPAAIISVVAFTMVPIVNRAVAWWGAVVHPKRVAMAAPMKITFLMGFLTVLCLGISIFLARLRLELLLKKRAFARSQEDFQ